MAQMKCKTCCKVSFQDKKYELKFGHSEMDTMRLAIVKSKLSIQAGSGGSLPTSVADWKDHVHCHQAPLSIEVVLLCKCSSYRLWHDCQDAPVGRTSERTVCVCVCVRQPCERSRGAHIRLRSIVSGEKPSSKGQ